MENPEEQPYERIGIEFNTRAECEAKELELSQRLSDGTVGGFGAVQEKYGSNPTSYFLDMSGFWPDMTEAERAAIVELTNDWWPPITVSLPPDSE